MDLLCRPRFEPVRTESSVTRVGQLLRGLGILSNNWLITPEVPLNAGSVRHSGTSGLGVLRGSTCPRRAGKRTKSQSPLTCATASAAQAPTSASGSAPTRSRWVGRCPEQRFRRYLGRVGPPEDRSRWRSSPVQARPAAIFEVMLTSSSVGLLQWTLGFRGGSHIAPSCRGSSEGLP